MPRINSPAELDARRGLLAEKFNPDKHLVAVYEPRSCSDDPAGGIADAFRRELAGHPETGVIDVIQTGCPGFSDRGAVVFIYPEGICYLNVTLDDVPEIVLRTVIGKMVIDRLAYSDPLTGQRIAFANELPFYKHQLRLVTGNNSRIDPRNIDHYLACGGYGALAKALAGMSPVQVIEEIKKSSLRGRSGGGFPTGLKWEACRMAAGGDKYVICNCHEGDPGAFVDRRVMEANPHSIIEGMVTGAWAIGAGEGIIFVGDEIPGVVENIAEAIAQAEEYGLLGENILGSGFDFRIRVNIDAGGYVCGESTALMASIEGREGEPVVRYDHATERGLWEKPTNLNNLQTWANVPLIIGRGADWYGTVGVGKSRGTRVFSLSGKIRNSGIIEVPLGISFREIVFDIGGGIPGNRRFNALQVGGPLGGFVPESLLDLPVDFEALTAAGLTMGPSLIVADEDNCIVDMVRYFLEFLAGESCGKCTPCREGIRQMLNIIENIQAGNGQPGDIGILERIAAAQGAAALCALGKGAANPLLGSLRHFRDEYDAHIIDKRCPALVCRALAAVSVS